MRSFLLFLLNVASFSSYAQLNFNWLFTDSGATNAYIYSSVVLNNKNLVVIGANDNNADLDPGVNTVTFNSKFFIAGYSPQQTLVFAKPFGYNGNLTANLREMIRDAADNIYVSFIGQGPWDFDPVPGIGEFNLPILGMAIVKFDSIGNFKWAVPYDSSQTLIRSMCVLPDLSLVAAGEMEGSTDLDPDTGVWMFTSPATPNTFLAIYDSTGHFITGKEIKTSGAYPEECVPNQISSDDAGNIFLSGYYSGTVDFDPGPAVQSRSAALNPGGYSKNFLLKLTPTLNFDFVIELYYGDEVAYSLYPDKNNELLITGNSAMPVDLDPSPGVMMINNQSQQCTFLAKYSSTGIPVWVKSLYTNSTYFSPLKINEIQSDGSMDVYFGLTDTIQSNSFGIYDVQATNDPYTFFYLLKLDSSGTCFYHLLLSPPNGISAANFRFSDPTHFYFYGRVLQQPVDVRLGPDISPLSSVNFSQFFISHYSLDYATNYLRGNVYYDFNLNASRDSTDAGAAQKIIEVQPGPLYVSTDNIGNYFLYLDTGLFSVSIPQLPPHVSATVPTIQTASFQFPNAIDTANDFALQVSPGDTDVSVILTQFGIARPGNTIHYSIYYSNSGSSEQSGYVNLTLDSSLTFISSSVAPSFINGNTIQWNYSSLTPFQFSNIDLETSISTLSVDSDSLISKAIIEPVNPDQHPIDNYDTSIVIVRSSYDPNSKSVDPPGPMGLIDVVNGAYLTYTIQFQNTGSDTAFNVTILDTVSQNLDLSTLSVIAASHPYKFNLYPGRMMEYKFNPILLPDSTTDEASSHGFIKYRIKPLSTLNSGDKIFNQAYIYFDFNEAVATNVVETEIQFIVSVPNTNNTSLVIYPNPASDKIEIKSQSSQLNEIQISDLSGKELLRNSIKTNSTVVDISSLKSGIYFLTVHDNFNFSAVYRITVIHQ